MATPDQDLTRRWDVAQQAGVRVAAVDCIGRPVLVTLSDGTLGHGDTTELAMADALSQWERRPAQGFEVCR